MKVEQGLKPQPKKAESPYIADLDTETPYFQAIDSAQTYIYSHDWPIAEQWLLKAIRLEPENPNNSLLLSNIATLQRYQGRMADAVKNYSLALDMTPHAVTLLLNRAALYVEMDSVQRAIDDFERVCELDMYNTEARYSLGVLAMERGDTKRACITRAWACLTSATATTPVPPNCSPRSSRCSPRRSCWDIVPTATWR